MENRVPEDFVFGLDIGTRSVVGIVGYKTSSGDFNAAAVSVRFHKTRAMLDGQIHDIKAVGQTIKEVKHELEADTGKKLENVCIAAAGRVLKTVTVHVDMDLFKEDEENVNIVGDYITEDDIHSLEMAAVEKAYASIKKANKPEKYNFFCVGYTCVHYYLNDEIILSLSGHKRGLIGADILATFLPGEVVDGLYSAVDIADLKVSSLTLEPIAAIQAAIPERFRMLNLALVDVGAGTSDICITDEGSIIAYGMIPSAGDELTVAIMKKYLVDFESAEKIKLAACDKNVQEIEYTDVMLLPGKTTRKDVVSCILTIINKTTMDIAKEIRALNGGKSVSAVFIVGGGGKYPEFAARLAFYLKLPKERVALRGEEVLGNVKILQDNIKKDSTLVTPVGICLNYYEQNNNFIYVELNGETAKLYDNGHLSVADAAVAVGYPNEDLFPKRGREIKYTLNGINRIERGEAGEPAQIFINGAAANISHEVKSGDTVEIMPSTCGSDARLFVSALDAHRPYIEFDFNSKKIRLKKALTCEGGLLNDSYEIKDGMNIKVQDFYTVNDIMLLLGMEMAAGITVDGADADGMTKVYDNSQIIYPLNITQNKPDMESGKQEEPGEKQEEKQETKPENEKSQSIKVNVNMTEVTLSGKSVYKIVDILDFYPFDIKTAHGKSVVIKRNGVDAGFSTDVYGGDDVKIYWD